MKIFFKKATSEFFSEFTIYNSLDRIPFILKLNSLDVLPETIYTRNLFGENFIEFRFDKNTKKLYEITLVAIQKDSVKLIEEYKIGNVDFFECFVDENSELDVSRPIQFLRSSESLSFIWGEKSSNNYFVSKNCILGVDDKGDLCSLSLINLSEDEICKILGF